MSKLVRYRTGTIEERLLRGKREVQCQYPELGCCWEWTNSKDKDGYGKCYLSKTIAGTKRHINRVHRLAAFVWLGYDPDSGLLVCHHCDNPSCFRSDHLFIGTPKDNTADKFIKRRDNTARGENHGLTTLTEEQVRDIRKRAIWGQKKIIAKEYGIHPATVRRICNGITWSHVA